MGVVNTHTRTCVECLTASETVRTLLANVCTYALKPDISLFGVWVTRAGKDRSVFVTKEDADKPAVVAELVDDTDGPILPDGSINWDCPCLGERFQAGLCANVPSPNQ